jgi:hypothetical protein
VRWHYLVDMGAGGSHLLGRPPAARGHSTCVRCCGVAGAVFAGELERRSTAVQHSVLYLLPSAVPSTTALEILLNAKQVNEPKIDSVKESYAAIR